MISSDPDLEMILADIRQDFIESTRDKLELVEDEIEALRSGSDGTERNILEIKRIIHSIKGAGGSFGFPTVTVIAHRLENYISGVPGLNHGIERASPMRPRGPWE